MPVTLRGINDPNTETVLLPALRYELLGWPTPNTNLAAISTSQTGLELFFINDKGALAQMGQPFPACSLTSTPVKRWRNSLSSYNGRTLVRLEYYDDPAQTSRTLDQVWSDVSFDLYRMLSNLENNDVLNLGGINYSAALEPYTVWDYEKHQFDTTTVPGKSLVKRMADIAFVILPYDVSMVH